MSVITLTFANVSCQIKTKMCNFHPLEVVDRGSETQLPVGEHLKYLIQLSVNDSYILCYLLYLSVLFAVVMRLLDMFFETTLQYIYILISDMVSRVVIE